MTCNLIIMSDNMPKISERIVEKYIKASDKQRSYYKKDLGKINCEGN